MYAAISAAIASSGPRCVLAKEVAWKAACTCTLAPTGNVPKLQVTVPAFSTPPLSAEIKLAPFGTVALNRSEEHTSELQSHVNIVCRLLLEKKTVPCSLESCRLSAG